MTIEIRDAVEADLAEILEIYNEAVEFGTAIFNETKIDLQNRKDWFEARMQRGFPIFVAIKEGRVAGYASYGDWRPFEGFRFSREHSVYIHKDARGHGIGRSLMQALIEHAESSDVHVLVGAIESSNEASIRLHESLGFKVSGTLHEVGKKFGRWLDLTYMQLNLPEKDQG